MADPRKTKKRDSDDEECIEEDMGSDEDVDSNDEDEMEVNEEVQVDFEGFGICDNDFHGIKQMLTQLFPKDSIDVTEITNLILGQNFIGTVLKQGEFDEDTSDDSNEIDELFGVTTCLSCNGMSKPNEVMNNMMKLLLEECDAHASTEKIKSKFRQVIQSKKEESCFGWVINERFINIPPQVSLPMFEKLTSELEEACKRKHKTCYDFTHFIMVCKTYDENQQEGEKKFQPQNLQFINSEEELFMEESVASFTYPMAGSNPLLTGKWDEDAKEMQPCRTVLLIERESFETSLSKLKEQLSKLVNLK